MNSRFPKLRPPKNVLVVSLLFIVLAKSTVLGEEIEPLQLRFAMIGPNREATDITITSSPSSGIAVTVAKKVQQEQFAGSYARSLHHPMLTYHSEKLGQLAIVPYTIGGGTGVSYSRYLVLCLTERSWRVLHDGLFEYKSVEPNARIGSFTLDSSIASIGKGYQQNVRLALLSGWDNAQPAAPRSETVASVDLQFLVQDGDGPKVEFATNIREARGLLKMIETRIPIVAEWAARTLGQHWPQFDALVQVFLATPESERHSVLGRLHHQVEEMISAAQIKEGE